MAVSVCQESSGETIAAAPCTVAATTMRPPADWDGEVLEAGGTIFHSSAMGAAAIVRGQEPWYLRLRRDGRTVGMALGAAIRSPSRLLGRHRRTLEFQTMPRLTGNGRETLRDAVRTIRGFARARGFDRIAFSSYADAQPDETPTLESEGLTLAPRLEFRVPLATCPDAMLDGMSSGHRQKIRKALRSGFQFVEDSSVAGAMTLRELQDVTYGRRHRRGNHGVHAWAIEDYRIVMSAYLAQRAIRFWFVMRDGRPLSAAGVMTFGPQAYYLLAGTSEEGYESGAAYAMMGHLIPYLITHGVHELNFGGMAVGSETEDHIEHGLYRFKMGFGANVIRCYTATGST